MLRSLFYLGTTFILVLPLLVCNGCKSGVNDADLQKVVSEKTTAVAGFSTGVTANVKEGVVTISGNFKDEASKEAFETTIRAIPGVQSVVNHSKLTTMATPAADSVNQR